MTAFKKNTSRSSASPAPATKAVPAKTKKTASAAAISVAPAPAPASRASAVKAIKSRPVVTTITARFDTGFGNALYVRGDGPGLNWESGVPMSCVSSDEWQLTLGESSRPITFKLLLNDLTWSAGGDFTVAAGDRVTVTPAF